MNLIDAINKMELIGEDAKKELITLLNVDLTDNSVNDNFTNGKLTHIKIGEKIKFKGSENVYQLVRISLEKVSLVPILNIQGWFNREIKTLKFEINQNHLYSLNQLSCEGILGFIMRSSSE